MSNPKKMNVTFLTGGEIEISASSSRKAVNNYDEKELSSKTTKLNEVKENGSIHKHT